MIGPRAELSLGAGGVAAIWELAIDCESACS